MGNLLYDNEQDELSRLFPLCEKISIDYAVMEKSKDIYVVASDLSWSDLGTWGSVKDHIPSDENDNHCVGEDIRLFASSGCLVHAPEAKTVVIDGLKDYVVSAKDGNILVCRLSEEQHIREYSAPGK